MQSTPKLKKEYKGKGTDLAFANVDDKDKKRDQPEDDVVELNRVSKLCGQFRDGTCPFKVKHTWKEYPRNKWGINFDKELDSKGYIILCQLTEFEDEMYGKENSALYDRVYGFEEVEHEDENNNIKSTVDFYYNSSYNHLILVRNLELIFTQESVSDRIALSQYKHKTDRWWVLLDNQSTVDLFSNKDLLVNIRKVNHHVTVHCNAGNSIVNVMGGLPGYGPV